MAPFLNIKGLCSLLFPFLSLSLRSYVYLIMLMRNPPPASQLAWLSQPTYTEFSATAGNYRGFCSKCGSTLLWRSEKEEKVEVLTGGVDEDVLRGRWGGVLAVAADGHCWGGNAVKGVTDRVGGGKVFEEGSGSRVIGGGEGEDERG